MEATITLGYAAKQCYLLDSGASVRVTVVTTEAASSGAAFDLVSEPWISVVRAGRATDVSLREAIVDAHQIDSLSMTDGPQFAGILRMLAALVMDAYPRPKDHEEWNSMRKAKAFDAVTFDAYVQRVGRNRFDLYDAQRPFMQSAATPDDGKTIAEILPHVAVGNTPPLFSPDTDKTPRAITPARAARSLVGYLAVAVPNPGKPKGDEGQGSWEGVSFAGRAGIIGFAAPVGATLFDTILLNIPSGKNPPEDVPAWRREEAPPAARRTRPATGMLDLLTWTPRRVRLLPAEDGAVSRICFRGGDALPYLDIHHEPHTALRTSDGKGPGVPAAGPPYPRKHLAHTLGWRGLPSLLAMTNSSGDVTARVFRDLGDRLTDLPTSYRVTVASLLVEFGSMSALYSNISFDAFPLPARSFGPDQDYLRGEMLNLVDRANSVRKDIRTLAWLVAQAATHESDKDTPGAGAYARTVADRFTADVDAATRRLLAGLAGGAERLAEGVEAWNTTVYRMAMRYCEQIMLASAERSFEGTVKVDERTQRRAYRAAPPVVSEAVFRSKLAKILPAAAEAEEGISA